VAINSRLQYYNSAFDVDSDLAIIINVSFLSLVLFKNN